MAIRALKQAEYYLFTRWMATPRTIRTPKTQGGFSDLYKVGHDTLARWKKEDQFWDDVQRSVRDWTQEYTPNVIYSVYLQTQAGNVHAMKLWFDYIDPPNVRPPQKAEPKLEEETLTGLLMKRAQARKQQTYMDIVLSESDA
jgi:hypothetical protein